MKVYGHREWFFKTILLMFILLLTTGIFNFVIDSAGIFRKNDDELQMVVHSLLTGKMISGLENYDDRQLHKKIIENSRKKFDIIIIGSSRVIQIRHSFLRFGDTNFFNHAMGGSTLEDYIAIVGLYESKGYLPSIIIIGVDPWIFNKNHGQTKWKTIGKYYDKTIGNIYRTEIESELSSNNSKYLQLINFDYTKENLEATIRNKTKFCITNTIDVDGVIREPDGNLIHPYKVRFVNDIDTQSNAKLDAQSPYLLESFYKLSNRKLFEDFITYLQQKNVEVMFLLPPYHPITYKLLVENPKYKIIMDVERYIKNIAHTRGIKISGSYDPEKNHFSSVDFFDGLHGKDIVVKKLCQKFSPD
jgi:hypothetical protein